MCQSWPFRLHFRHPTQGEITVNEKYLLQRVTVIKVVLFCVFLQTNEIMIATYTVTACIGSIVIHGTGSGSSRTRAKARARLG